MLNKKKVSIKTEESLGIVLPAVKSRPVINGPSAINMGAEDFSAFLRTEMKTNRIKDRIKFLENLVRRIMKIFTSEQISRSIILYLYDNNTAKNFPETIQAVIDELGNESCPLFEIRQRFQEKLEEYQEMAEGDCTVDKKLKKKGVRDPRYAKELANIMLLDHYKILDEVLEELHITEGDLITMFFDIVKDVLGPRSKKRRDFREMGLDQYIEKLSLLSQIPSHKVKVIGLLGDMEFLMGAFMDSASEVDTGFAYLSRLTMMDKTEYTDLSNNLSKTRDVRNQTSIKLAHVKRTKAHRYLYHLDEKSWQESGIFIEAARDTKTFIKTGTYIQEDILQYFLASFTRRLRGLIESNPEARSLFQDIYTRLIEPHIRDHDYIIFADTGFKGTLPTLACALISIFGKGKRGGIFLYSVRSDLAEIIPSLFKEILSESRGKKVPPGKYSVLETDIKRLHDIEIDPETRLPYLLVTPAKYLRFFDDMHRIYYSMEDTEK